MLEWHLASFQSIRTGGRCRVPACPRPMLETEKAYTSLAAAGKSAGKGEETRAVNQTFLKTFLGWLGSSATWLFTDGAHQLQEGIEDLVI